MGAVLLDRIENAAVAFKTASELLQTRLERPHLSTGIAALDGLLGGVEQGGFYLFYGEEGGASDLILQRLMVNCIKPSALGGFNGKAFYLNCGNYKRSRTILDVDPLFRLMEDEGLDVVQASKRIYTVCAFSEMQQMRAADEIERIVGEDSEIRLIAVQQIAKLFAPALIMPREEAMPNFQNFVSRLKRLSIEGRIILAASCRQTSHCEAGIPLPEGGGFLRHEANVMVHLREAKGSRVAFLVKHPDRGRQGLRVMFDGGGNVGRFTPSLRQRIVEAMEGLRRTYRSAFKDEGMRAAFDEVWKKWDSEMAAMIYSDVATPMDLLALTAALDNRRVIDELRRELEKVKRDRCG